MTDTASDVSVVLCSYTERRWNDLVAAVESLRTQTQKPREVIVVVDHNKTLLDRVQARWTEIVAVENEGSRGLAAARNSGVAAATGDIVAFLDDDALPQGDWLQELCRPYDDLGVAAVGGAVEPNFVDARPHWLPLEFDWVVGCSYRGLPTTTTTVRNVIGANMSLRRLSLLAAGGFRVGLGRVGSVPLGCEETELFLRLSRRFPEWRVVYVPEARVSHKVPPERGTWRYFFARCYGEGKSKAALVRLDGVTTALASERTYVIRTLSRGIANAIIEASESRRLGGLVKIAAIVTGLGATVAGYARETVAPTIRLEDPQEHHVAESGDTAELTRERSF